MGCFSWPARVTEFSRKGDLLPLPLLAPLPPSKAAIEKKKEVIEKSEAYEKIDPIDKEIKDIKNYQRPVVVVIVVVIVAVVAVDRPFCAENRRYQISTFKLILLMTKCS